MYYTHARPLANVNDRSYRRVIRDLIEEAPE